MTYQELAALPHIESAKVISQSFLYLKAEEGYQITDYADGDPIERFYSSRGRSLLMRGSYSDKYRTITDTEAERLATQRDEARIQAQEQSE